MGVVSRQLRHSASIIVLCSKFKVKICLFTRHNVNLTFFHPTIWRHYTNAMSSSSQRCSPSEEAAVKIVGDSNISTVHIDLGFLWFNIEIDSSIITRLEVSETMFSERRNTPKVAI